MESKHQDKSSLTAVPLRLMDSQGVDQLFLRFAAIWGHSWQSRFQSQPLLVVAKGEWAMDLSGYRVDLIARAITRAKGDYPEFPPTLPQFTAICKSLWADDERTREARRVPVKYDTPARVGPRNDIGKRVLDDLMKRMGITTTRSQHEPIN